MTTPAARAAGLFLGAFNIAFEDDERMTISVHTEGGMGSAYGHLAGGLMVFVPRDVAFLLDRLTDLLSQEKPQGTITVTVPSHEAQGAPIEAWAWSLTPDGTEPVSPALAITLLPENADFPGPEGELGDGTFQTPPSAAMDGGTLAELRHRGLAIEDVKFD